MSKLSFMEKLLDGVEVEWKALGDCSSIKRGRRVTKNELGPEKQYPVYSGGVTPMGYFENYNYPANTITIVKYGTAGFVNFIEEDFWANDVCYCVKPCDVLDNKYLFYLLKSKQHYIQSQATNAIPAHLPTVVIENIIIPLPPLEIQKEIAKVLDFFTELEAELEAELTARKKQYNYYRDQLLSFEEGEVEWKTLGDVAVIGTGSHDTKDAIADGDYIFYARGRDPLKLDVFDFDETAIITAGDGAGVGKVYHYAQGKYALHQRAYRIVPSEVMNPRFVFHYISAFFYVYIQKASVSSSVTSLRRPMFINFPIPVPSLAEQTRIVAILDKFEALVSDISIGLPAELAARRKQYEYYRSKLLTFEPLVN